MIRLLVVATLAAGCLIGPCASAADTPAPVADAAPSERVAKKLGADVVAMLGRVERVEAFRVAKLAPEQAGAAETVGARTIEGEAKKVDKDFSSRLARALLADGTYFRSDSKGTSAGVGYRLWTNKKECIEISCCVSKGNVWLVVKDADGKLVKGQSRPLGGFRDDRDSPMRALAAEAFPDDKDVQKYKPAKAAEKPASARAPEPNAGPVGDAPRVVNGARATDRAATGEAPSASEPAPRGLVADGSQPAKGVAPTGDPAALSMGEKKAPSSPGHATYEKDIKPLLRAKCEACHGPTKQKGGFDTSNASSLLKGGESGTGVKPGSLKDSAVWFQVAIDKMPPGKEKLTDTEKQLIADWVQYGSRAGQGPVAKLDREFPPTGRKMSRGELTAFLDREVDAALQAAKVPASSRSEDHEFLRRVTLDLTGTIPTLEKARAFLDSKDPGKRAKLIDDLIASPEYADWFSYLWMKRLVDHAKSGNTEYLPVTRHYLHNAVRLNKPWSEIATEILTFSRDTFPPEEKTKRAHELAETSLRGAGGFYFFDTQFGSIDRHTNKLSRYFLGIELGCAQCHNHPFSTLKQSDYWGVAAFFSRMSGFAGEAPLAKPKTGGDGYMSVPPKFLQGAEVAVGAGAAFQPLRPQLAKWLTARDNPYFSRALVNRTWSHFFDRGLVNPVDDMIDANPPTHPRLLRELSYQFVENGFDAQFLIRAICNSEAYQRSSLTRLGNEKDRELYSHHPKRGLLPHQVFDARQTAMKGVTISTKGQRISVLNPDKSLRDFDKFLRDFEEDTDIDRRGYRYGVSETLRFLNHPTLADPTTAGKRLTSVEDVYLTALSRRPTADEARVARDHIARSKGGAAEAYADLFWVLINSPEFLVIY